MAQAHIEKVTYMVTPTVVIESYSIPSSAKAKEYVPFSITGHVTAAGDNAGVAFAYMDGPAASITINYEGVDYEITKGRAFALYRTGTSAISTRITLSAKVKYPQEGTYTVAALAGYVDVEKSTFYYTDRRDVTVTITPPPVIYASLSGIVTANIGWVIRRPVRGALVTLDEKSTYTDPTGAYSFTNIPVGSYTLTVSRILYSTHTETVSLTEAKAYTKDVEVGIKPLITVAAIGSVAVGGVAVVATRRRKT